MWLNKKSITYIHDAVLLWVEEEPVVKEGQFGIRSSHVWLEVNQIIMLNETFPD